MQVSFTLVPSLKKKYQTAISSRQASLEVLSDLDSCVDPELYVIYGRHRKRKHFVYEVTIFKSIMSTLRRVSYLYHLISHICIHCKHSTISSKYTSTT